MFQTQGTLIPLAQGQCQIALFVFYSAAIAVLLLLLEIHFRKGIIMIIPPDK